MSVITFFVKVYSISWHISF